LSLSLRYIISFQQARFRSSQPKTRLRWMTPYPTPLAGQAVNIVPPALSSARFTMCADTSTADPEGDTSGDRGVQGTTLKYDVGERGAFRLRRPSADGYGVATGPGHDPLPIIVPVRELDYWLIINPLSVIWSFISKF
jgi:hypothetical protein